MENVESQRKEKVMACEFLDKGVRMYSGTSYGIGGWRFHNLIPGLYFEHYKRNRKSGVQWCPKCCHGVPGERESLRNDYSFLSHI